MKATQIGQLIVAATLALACSMSFAQTDSKTAKTNRVARRSLTAAEDSQTRFLLLVGMTNYVAKLGAATNGMLPNDMVISGEIGACLYLQGLKKEYAWIPADTKYHAVSIDEIHKKCGPPDKMTANKMQAAWGHVGYISVDGKTLDKVVFFPYAAERDAFFEAMNKTATR